MDNRNSLTKSNDKSHHHHQHHTSSNINKAVVAHLHKLEVKNQQLEREKVSLQHQLNRVLQHLKSPVEAVPKEVEEKVEPTKAPLARYEYVGGSYGSLFESNGALTIPEYSSLSDVYEDICLNQDPVEQINGSIYSEDAGKTDGAFQMRDISSVSSAYGEQQQQQQQQQQQLSTLWHPNSMPNSPPYPSWYHSLTTEVATEHELRTVMDQLYNWTTSTTSATTASVESLKHDAGFDCKPSRTHSPYAKATPLLAESSGPPKIQITRKQIRTREDFSDSTSGSSLHLVSHHPLFKKDYSVHSQLATSGKSNARPIPLSVPADQLGRKHTWTKESIQPGPSNVMNKFLQSRFTLDLEDAVGKYYQLIVKSSAESMFKGFATMIHSLEVFSCISNQSYLIQTIHLSTQHLFPIFANYPCSHISQQINNQSSDSLSQNSLQLNLTTSKLLTDVPVSNSSLDEDVPVSDRPTNLDLEPEHSIIHQDFLFKLNNHLKLWHRFWGVLTSQSLFLHQTRKIKHFATLKSSVKIDDIRQICRIQPYGSAPVQRKLVPSRQTSGRTGMEHFEVILNTSAKSIRLRGLNFESTQLWMMKLRQTMRMKEAQTIFNRLRNQLVQQGWLKRIKGTQSNWLWCCLTGSYLMYFPHCNSSIPVGFRCLTHTQIQTSIDCTLPSAGQTPTIRRTSSVPQVLTTSSDSDSILLQSLKSTTKNRSIKLLSKNHETVNLICASQAEFYQWHDSLARACLLEDADAFGGVQPGPTLGHFEQIWTKLVGTHHAACFYHICHGLSEPLSKTTHPAQSDVALQMFDHLIFLAHPHFEWANVDKGPVGLTTLFASDHWFNVKHFVVSWIVDTCTSYAPLKDELYLQLMRQLVIANLDLAKPPAKDAFNLVLKERSQTVSVASSGRHVFSNLLSCAKSHDLTDDHDLVIGQDGYQLVLSKLYKAGPFKLDPLRNYLNDTIQQRLVVLPGSMKSSQTTLRMFEAGWPSFAMWQCLALFLSIMLPSGPVLCALSHLLVFYQQNQLTGDTGFKHQYKQEVGRYAAFCLETLARVRNANRGVRIQPPSIFELVAISLRNPYIHECPFSLPIYLPFGYGYEVIGFYGDSQIQNIIDQLIDKFHFAQIQTGKFASFGLYLCLFQSADDLPTYFKQIYLNADWKLCDVISVYEQCIMATHSDRIKMDQLQVKLVFKIHTVDWKSIRGSLRYDLSQLGFFKFLVHQLHSTVVTLDYHVTLSHIDFVELVAHLCRIDYVEYGQMQARRQTTFGEALESYLPSQWLDADSADLFVQLKFVILDRWNKLGPVGPIKFVPTHVGSVERCDFEMIEKIHSCLAYLNLLRNLHPGRFQTCAFLAFVHNLPNLAETQLVWLVPQEERLNILITTDPNVNSSQHVPTGSQLQLVKTIPYHVFISYGAQKSNLFFVVYMELSQNTGVLKKSSTNYCCSNSSESSSQLTIFNSHSHGSPLAHYDNNASHVRHPCMKTRKLKMRLLTIHHLIEFTNSLNFLINLQQFN